MRTVFRPTPYRRSPETERLLSQLAQDTVQTGRDTEFFALLNAYKQEIERALGTMTRMDPRPWRSDVFLHGSADQTDPDDDRWSDLVYEVPPRMEIEPIRAYSYRPSINPIRNDQGQVIGTDEVDRVVETRDGLLIQVGDRLIRFQGSAPEPVLPEDLGLRSFDRMCLASLGIDRPTILPGRAQKWTERPVQIEDLTRVVFHGAGQFEMTIRFTGSVALSNGDTVDPAHFEEAGALYDDAGNRRSYTLSGDPPSITVGGIIEEGNGEQAPSGSYLLFYDAKTTRTYSTPALPPGETAETVRNEVSIADLVEEMYRIPTSDQITLQQNEDVIARIPRRGNDDPMEIDAFGFAGPVSIDHSIQQVLPSEFHTFVLGGQHLSIIEDDASSVVFHQRFPSITPVGLTWSREGELALVDAQESGWRVIALRPNPEGSTEQGWTPASNNQYYNDLPALEQSADTE